MKILCFGEKVCASTLNLGRRLFVCHQRQRKTGKGRPTCCWPANLETSFLPSFEVPKTVLVHSLPPFPIFTPLHITCKINNLLVGGEEIQGIKN